MFYEWAVTIPANTAAIAPVVQLMELTAGMIIRLEIQFPAGCAGLAHCKILDQDTQKWPTPPSESFASDNHAILIEENQELLAAPYQLRAICWNLDDTFEHTLYIRVGLLQGAGAVLVNKVFQGLAKMLALMGIK